MLRYSQSNRMHRERQTATCCREETLHATFVGRACLPAIKVTAAEGFFFFGLFSPTVAPYLSNAATPAERREREVRHVFKDIAPLFFGKIVSGGIRQNRGSSIEDTRLGDRLLSAPEIVLTVSADLRTLSVRLEETARKEDSL